MEDELTVDEAFAKFGLDRTAPFETVASAYRRLATKYHPDVLATSQSHTREAGRQQMITINAAYEVASQFIATSASPAEAPEETVDQPPPKQRTPKKPPQEKPSPKKRPRKKRSANQPEPILTLRCPSCSKRIRVPVSLCGRLGTCSSCKSDIKIPTDRIVHCQDCRKKSKVPYNMGEKQAVCWNCLSTIVTPPIR